MVITWKLLKILTWGLQMHILSVMGNVYGTLDVVPGVIPNPQLWKIT